jgi:hypothetical protein
MKRPQRVPAARWGHLWGQPAPPLRIILSSYKHVWLPTAVLSCSHGPFSVAIVLI